MKTLKKKTKKRIPSWDELREMFRETDKRFQETDKKFQETDKKFQDTDKKFQETDKKFQETDKKFQVTDKMFQETDKVFQEADKMLQETARRSQETERRIQRTDKQVDRACEKLAELANSFSSQTGHIIEGLMEPSAMRMFQERGYNINRCWKNFKRYVKELDKRLEVDLLLLDDEIAIIVEVKTNCTCKNIDHFVSQMQSFKKVCPEYADKKILLAIAAINYDREAVQHAHKQGLFVIRVSNDNIFTLDSTDGDTLLTL